MKKAVCLVRALTSVYLIALLILSGRYVNVAKMEGLEPFFIVMESLLLPFLILLNLIFTAKLAFGAKKDREISFNLLGVIFDGICVVVYAAFALFLFGLPTGYIRPDFWNISGFLTCLASFVLGLAWQIQFKKAK